MNPFAYRNQIPTRPDCYYTLYKIYQVLSTNMHDRIKELVMSENVIESFHYRTFPLNVFNHRKSFRKFLNNKKGELLI